MNKLIFGFTFISFFAFVNPILTAQNKNVAAKLVYGELFGPGVVMSANFDSRFDSDERMGLGYRIGIGYGFEQFDENIAEFLFGDGKISSLHDGVMRTFYSFPAGINYVFGNQRRASTFEVGVGVTFLTRNVSIFNWEMEKPGHFIGFLNFMYRLMPVNGGVTFRIGFSPMIGTAGDLFPMGAVGLGYAF